MGNIAILGAPNVVATVPGAAYALGYGEISAGSAASGMPATNAQTEEPSEVWRTASTPWPFDCWLGWGPTTAKWPEPKIDAVGVVNHNLTTAALVRVIRGSWTEYLRVPDSIAASTNMTGAVTAIDEGKAPGGDYVTVTDSTLTASLRVTFEDPSAAPRTGSKQFFAVFLKRQALSPDTNKTPHVHAYLCEGGTQRQDLGAKYVRSTSGQWLVWAWDQSSLVTTDGSAVELRLDVDASHVGLSIDTIVWVCERAADLSGAMDSGWLTPVSDLGATAWGGLPVYDQAPHQSFVYLHGSTTTAGSIFVFLVDDGAPTTADATLELIPEPPTYVQVGCLVAGVAFRPAVNVDWGPMLGSKDLSDKATTDGGQSYGVRRPVLRTLNVPLSWLTQDEAHALFDRLVLRRGTLAPVLLAWDPDSATEAQLPTFWATLDGAPTMEAIAAFGSDGKSRRRLGFSFVEKR